MINGITHENEGCDIKEFDKELLSNIEEIYICPSFKCNIACKHCTLHNDYKKTSISNIIDTLDFIKNFSTNQLSYDLFGGEPLLNSMDDIKLLLSHMNGEKQISTNLLLFDKKWTDIFKEFDTINTSFDTSRFFNHDILNVWENKLNQIRCLNIPINIMTVLNNELINTYTPKEFVKLMTERFKPYSIDFEYHIGSDCDDKQALDNWLLDLYKNGLDDSVYFRQYHKIKRSIYTDGSIKYIDCSKSLTILPNGNVHKYCAYYENDILKSKCYTCRYFKYCNGGCPLVNKCTYPISLHEEIINESNIFKIN